MKENTNEKSDNLAAIGIGAMIVFIALILVAAVAAAVIIQTAEKLQQNAQNTGAETTNMLSSKVMVLSIMVTGNPDTPDLYITFELAPGSADISPLDIDYSIVCEDTSVFGTFGNAGFVGNDVSVGAGLLEAHTTYDLKIRSGATGFGACEPVANEAHTLLIQSRAGGYTFEKLNYGSDVSPGAVVV